MPDEKIWKEFISSRSGTTEFTDFCGNIRTFELSGFITIGYTIIAKEIGGNPGYEFEAFSFSSPHEAMNKLVDKIRLSLATRNLDPNHFPHLLAQRCTGRVVGEGVVVDGQLVSWDKLIEMVQSHEGWEFELKFGGA